MRSQDVVDMHVTEATGTVSGRRRVRLFYHIPIDAPVTRIGPTPDNAGGRQLRQADIDALAASSVLDVWSKMVILPSQTLAKIADAVRVDCNDKYDFVFKFYRGTLDATA
jgi:hypothetical protein